jgi:hypothetical protein
MIRFLVRLYPKEWRRSYGDEFVVLLEETRVTAPVILDVLVQALKLHAGLHRTWLLVGAAAFMSVAVEIIALMTGLTANVLWPPTTPARAVALLALAAPWTALAVRGGRMRSHRPPARS